MIQLFRLKLSSSNEKHTCSFLGNHTCTATNDQHNCSFSWNASVQRHCGPLQFMGQDPSSSLSLHLTRHRDLMTIHCPQTSIIQRKTEFYPVFSFLRSIESRRKGCESAFFRSKELLTDVRVSKTVAMVESSTSCVKLGAMGGVLPFVINAVVRKCGQSFQLVFLRRLPRQCFGHI